MKERGGSLYSYLFPSSKVNFSFFNEKEEYLTDLESIYCDVRVCWLGCECDSHLSDCVQITWLLQLPFLFPETQELG